MKIVKTCESCGKVYERFPCQAKTSRFCSHRCCAVASGGRAAKERAAQRREALVLPNPVPGAVWLPLSQRAFVLVDEADATIVGNAALSLGNHGYARVGTGGRHQLLHRLITQCPKGMHVDHINGNRLDCRRGNLRIVTSRENHQNQPARGGKSRFKGVSLVKGRWLAKIRIPGSRIHLGSFANEEDAARAYDDASRRLRGGNDRMNFPLPGEHSALKETA